MLLKLILSFFILGMSIVSFSQNKKFEQEKAIKKEHVPDRILELLDPYLEDAKKTKFYQETDGEHESIEVKFHLNDKKYSIEFYKNSELEDVEVVILWDEIPDNIQDQIHSTLSTKADRHKIDKIQLQLSSEEKSDSEIIKNALKNGTGDIMRYELEVELKQEGKWTPFEMLFDNTGKLLSEKVIVKRTSDFILY